MKFGSNYLAPQNRELPPPLPRLWSIFFSRCSRVWDLWPHNFRKLLFLVFQTKTSAVCQCQSVQRGGRSRRAPLIQARCSTRREPKSKNSIMKKDSGTIFHEAQLSTKIVSDFEFFAAARRRSTRRFGVLSRTLPACPASVPGLKRPRSYQSFVPP